MLQGHKVGRQGVKDVQRLSGMDAEPYNFQYDSTKGRASNFRLDCIKSKQIVEPPLSVETGTSSVPARPPKVIQKAIFNNIQSESCDEVKIAA